MKKITLLLAGLMLLAGCAKQPVIANLNPHIGEQTAGIYASPQSAAVTAKDSRKIKDVVVYLTDDPQTSLANVISVQDVVADRLREGLRSQGLRVEPNSPVKVKLEIDELQVRVSRPKVLYSADGKTYMTLTVENKKGAVLTKSYKREASKESATRPDLPKLEEMLNSHIAEIIQQILQDVEVRNIIGRG